ncbi:odorant receptor 49b-like [Sabethes cyaneus]|uniref:odorant receptor 49b-like n=1 Tax=Sabethes cyaneus TaxID=53552 RepID=UPI00237DF3BA|nr:odorant receptor 49b-like [Sabethes cyaneus]
MDPKFEAATKIARYAFRVVNSDVFNDQWTPNSWSITAIVLLSMVPVCTIFWKNPAKISTVILTENIGLTFVSLQTIHCLLEIIVKRNSWKNIMKEVEQRRYQYKTPKSSPVFDEFYQRTVLFSKFIYAMYFSTSCYYLFPIVAADPEKFYLPFGFTLPLLDVKTSLGYCLNYVYQVLIVTICQHSLCGHFSTVTVAVLSACCQIRCIKILLRDLNELLNSPIEQPEAIRELLAEIINLHATNIEFIQRLQNLLSWVYLTIFITCGMVTFSTLNMVVDNPWTSATFLFIGGTGSVLLHCFYGNMLLVENDTLADAFYAIDWYWLAVRERKAFRFTLANAQPDMQLHGIFAPVNQATSVAIIRAAFSYFSILMNFSSE